MLWIKRHSKSSETFHTCQQSIHRGRQVQGHKCFDGLLYWLTLKTFRIVSCSGPPNPRLKPVQAWCPRGKFSCLRLETDSEDVEFNYIFSRWQTDVSRCYSESCQLTSWSFINYFSIKNSIYYKLVKMIHCLEQLVCQFYISKVFICCVNKSLNSDVLQLVYHKNPSQREEK